MSEKKTFAESKEKRAEFLVRDFKATIDQVPCDEKCSGKFADHKWLRGDCLARGQAYIEQKGIPALVKHLAGFRKNNTGVDLNECY
jgi:hypothetical protein